MSSMSLIFQFIIFIMIIFMAYRVIRFIVNVKGEMLFPISESELSKLKSIKHESFRLPTLPAQKYTLIIQVSTIMLAVAILALGAFIKGFEFEWYTYLSVINLSVITYFIVPNPVIGFTEKGILYRMRFIPWKKVKSYALNPVDVHSFNNYFLAKELTDACEVKIDVPFYPVKVIVLSSEMKGRLTGILDTKIAEKESEVLIK